jgi:hypothetical protein
MKNDECRISEQSHPGTNDECRMKPSPPGRRLMVEETGFGLFHNTKKSASAHFITSSSTPTSAGVS